MLSFIDELATVVLNFYYRSGNIVISTNSVIGCFTVMVDDNIDVNSCSPTATNHFHGPSVTLLHSPAVACPGTVKDKRKLKEMSDKQVIDDLIAFKRYSIIPNYDSTKVKVCSHLRVVNIDQTLAA